MNGKLHQKSTYGLSRSLTLSNVLEALLLTGLGMLAITLHARWRFPLNIPGHHGLEFMALLMLGRSFSRFRFASGFSSLGIGILLLFPIFGFRDPLMGFYYTLPGFVLDLLYNAYSNRRHKWLIILLISGLAYFMIPHCRLIVMTVTGYPYASFIKHGTVIPLISFFLFGALGGAIGAGITTIIKKFI
jgi:hypothetical protein